MESTFIMWGEDNMERNPRSPTMTTITTNTAAINENNNNSSMIRIEHDVNGINDIEMETTMTTSNEKRRLPHRKKRISAYSLFYHVERRRIISYLDNNDSLSGDNIINNKYIEGSYVHKKYTKDDIIQYIQQKELVKRRKHRKTSVHGKISSGELTRFIAKRWKQLSNDEMFLFQDFLTNIETKSYINDLAPVVNDGMLLAEFTKATSNDLLPCKGITPYSIFFHLERQRILKQLDNGITSVDDILNNNNNNNNDVDRIQFTKDDIIQCIHEKEQEKTELGLMACRKQSRNHRKINKNIAYTDLRRIIKNRWNTLSYTDKMMMFHKLDINKEKTTKENDDKMKELKMINDNNNNSSLHHYPTRPTNQQQNNHNPIIMKDQILNNNHNIQNLNNTVSCIHGKNKEDVFLSTAREQQILVPNCINEEYKDVKCSIEYDGMSGRSSSSSGSLPIINHYHQPKEESLIDHHQIIIPTSATSNVAIPLSSTNQNEEILHNSDIINDRNSTATTKCPIIINNNNDIIDRNHNRSILLLPPGMLSPNHPQQQQQQQQQQRISNQRHLEYYQSSFNQQQLEHQQQMEYQSSFNQQQQQVEFQSSLLCDNRSSTSSFDNNNNTYLHHLKKLQNDTLHHLKQQLHYCKVIKNNYNLISNHIKHEEDRNARRRNDNNLLSNMMIPVVPIYVIPPLTKTITLRQVSRNNT